MAGRYLGWLLKWFSECTMSTPEARAFGFFLALYRLGEA